MSSLASTVESIELLRPGLEGIEQARETIQRKITQGGQHWLTIQRAREIVARAPPWDEEAQVQELFNYFISPVTGFPYRRDPVNVQHIEAAPSWPKGGDCKKYAVQLGAYCEALGMPVEVVICGQHAPACGRAPRFHHVFVRALVNGRRVSLDPTLHRPTAGFYAEAGDELPHAIERTYPMNGFAAANQLGDFNLFDAVRAFGRFVDPTRSNSVTRGLIASIPGVGQGAIALADTVASANRALTAGSTAEPATALSLSPAPAPSGTQVDSSQADTVSRIAAELKNGGGGGSSLPKYGDGDKKQDGISAGVIVGGVAAVGVVGGIVYAALRAGKRKH